MHSAPRRSRYLAVRTTGVFCRPTCAANPDPGNVETFATVGEVLVAGYRPCKRCHPLHGRAHPPRRGRQDRLPVASVTVIDTPLGPMVAAATDDRLVLLEFADRRMLATQLERLAGLLHCDFERAESSILERTRSQLAEYFAGARRAFDLPLDAPGTGFQQAAWSALRAIPAGTTRSYAEQAAALGRPEAVRAVARANGDNRLAIVVPCHRVVGSDGRLTGYSGGLWRKRRLLELEAARPARVLA